MIRKQVKKAFEPGRGYTQEDWDAVESPELSDDELAAARPAAEVLPPAFFAGVEEARKKRGRPALESPKKLTSLRLDQEVLDKFKATGHGWQSRINDVLKAAKV